MILKKGSLIKLNLIGLSSPIYLRNKYYDTHIFHQIFIRKELDFEIPNNPKVIVDCGANIGLSTLYLKRKYKESKIISIEPEESNFNMLSINTRQYKDVDILQNAVWFKNTLLQLVDGGEGHASFKTFENRSGYLKKEITNQPISLFTDLNNIQVTFENTSLVTTDRMVVSFGEITYPSKFIFHTVSISEIVRKFNLNSIDLIKLDIEGSEFEIFKHEPLEWIKNINCIAVEIHENMRPGCTDLIDTALKQDFTKSYLGEYSIYIKNINF